MQSPSYSVKVVSKGQNGSSAEAAASISRWAAPTGPQLVVANDTRELLASWLGDAGSYVVVLKSGDAERGRVPASAPPVKFPAGALAVGEYIIEVAALGGSSRMPSLPTAPSNPVAVLAAPGAVDVVFDSASDILKVSWASSGTAPSGYDVRLLGESNDAGATPVPAASGTVGVDIPLAQVTSVPGTYHVEIFAVGSETALASQPVRSASTVVRLAALGNPTQSADKANKALVVSWPRLEGAAQYRIELFVPGSDQPLESRNVDQPAATTETVTEPIDIHPYLRRDGVSIIARVRSNGEAHVLAGAYAAAPQPVLQLAAPQGLSMSLQDGGAVLLAWQGVVGAVQYPLEIKDGGGKAVYSRVLPASPIPGITLQKTDFSEVPNGKYLASIQALADGTRFDSNIVEGDSMYIINLPAPVLKPLVLTETPEEGTVIVATLADEVPMADGYEADLVVNGGRSGRVVPMHIDPPVIEARLPVDWVSRGSSFQVLARATRTGYSPSEWALSPNTFSRLLDPNLAPLWFEGNLLMATLAMPVPGADRYQAYLVVEGNRVGPSTNLATSSTGEICASFALTVDQEGTAFQVEVQALGDGQIPSQWKRSADTLRYEPTGAPSHAVLSLEGSALVLRWLHAIPSLDFQAELWEENPDAPLDPQPAMTYDGNNSATISLAGLKADTPYKARVRRRGSTSSLGWWTDFSEVLSTPPIGPTKFAKDLAGNQQREARTAVPGVAGGQVDFKPLVLLVMDEFHRPVPDADVVFQLGDHPPGMSVQLQSSGSPTLHVKTDAGGLATLNAMPGGASVRCSNGEGNVFVVAYVNSIGVNFVLTVAPTPA
jgi:hypothetical protein